MKTNEVFTTEEALAISEFKVIPFKSAYTAFRVTTITNEDGTSFWVEGKLNKRWWAINYMGKDFVFATKEDANMVKRSLTKLRKNPVFD